MNDGTGAQPMPGQIQTRAGVQVAANAAAAGNSNAKCFAPDETQIANLLGRTSYSASVTASWQSASSVSLVPIDLCPNAKAQLAAALNANANINYMQNAVATNTRIKSKLQPGYDPKDVLAVDKSGDDLTVYVY